MKEAYFESVVMIERLHRLFLEVVKGELDEMNIHDINNVQCLILYNIGKGKVTVGELTNRGYYLGSNVSYNLRKMVQSEYLMQEPSPHDRRSSHVALSKKGTELYNKLDDMLQSHVGALKDKGLSDDVCKLGETLKHLDSFWNDMMPRR